MQNEFTTNHLDSINNFEDIKNYMNRRYLVNFVVFDTGSCEIELSEELVKDKTEEQLNRILLDMLKLPKPKNYGDLNMSELEVETHRDLKFEEIC